MSKKRQCAEWYASTVEKTAETYKNVVLGFIGKFASGIIGLALLLTGSPLWFSLLSKNIIISYLLILFGILLIVIVSISLVYNRGHKKSLELISLLHNINHYVRDIYCDCLANRSNLPVIKEITGKLCVKIKEYFSKLKRTDEIGVAIRLVNKDNEDKIVYETVASANLNPQRSKTSEGICDNEGIPLYFYSKNYSGVVIYNDIEEASRQSIYKLTKNDKTYKEEIQSFIVAPLNCFDGSDKSMIGLLYITSQKKHYFDIRDVEHIKAIADLISILISQILFSTKKQDNI